MSLKKQIKVVGWDDGPFDYGQEEPVPLVGVVTRGGEFVEGVLTTEIEVDGLDATRKLSTALEESKYGEDLSLVILDGITVGGFNVVDVKELADRTGLPVLVVTNQKPDLDSFRAALKNVSDFERRWKAAQKAGPLGTATVRGNQIHYQKRGLTKKEAEEAIEITARHSSLPEPVRLASLIAKSLVKGEG